MDFPAFREMTAERRCSACGLLTPLCFVIVYPSVARPVRHSRIASRKTWFSLAPLRGSPPSWRSGLSFPSQPNMGSGGERVRERGNSRGEPLGVPLSRRVRLSPPLALLAIFAWWPRWHNPCFTTPEGNIFPQGRKKHDVYNIIHLVLKRHTRPGGRLRAPARPAPAHTGSG